MFLQVEWWGQREYVLLRFDICLLTNFPQNLTPMPPAVLPTVGVSTRLGKTNFFSVKITLLVT